MCDSNYVNLNIVFSRGLWCPPPQNSFKIDLDEDYFFYLSIFGIGIIDSNCLGELVGGVPINLGRYFITEITETMIVVEVIKFVKILNL